MDKKKDSTHIQVQVLYDKIKEGVINLRNELGLTQAEFSNKIGKGETYIGKLERGNGELHYDAFHGIALLKGQSTRKLYQDIVTSSPRYVISKYNSISGNQKPRLINRYGFSESRDKLTFYSLLDPVDEEQKIITDFQMHLVLFQADGEGSHKHYHPGDEVAFILDGELNFRYLSMINNKEDWKDLQLYSDRKNFVSFDCSIPHKYRSDVTSKVLTILDDPRGEAGLYKYDTSNESTKVEQVSTYNEDSKIGCIANGFGFKLKYHRLKLGLSIQELANRTHVAPSSISRLEKNEINIPIRQLIALAIFGLDMSPEALLSDRTPKDLKINLRSLEMILKDDNSDQQPYYQRNIIQTERGLKVDVLHFTSNQTSMFITHLFDVAFFVFKGRINFHIGDPEQSGELLSRENTSLEMNVLDEWDTIYFTKGLCYAIEGTKDTIVLKVSKKMNNVR